MRQVIYIHLKVLGASSDVFGSDSKDFSLPYSFESSQMRVRPHLGARGEKREREKGGRRFFHPMNCNLEGFSCTCQAA